MVDREKLVVASTEIKRLIEALLALSQPLKRGQAAALGTLTSIQRRFDLIAVALEGREANATDRSEVVNSISTLKWLSDDRYILADLPDDIPLDGHDSYSSAIGDLISASEAAIN